MKLCNMKLCNITLVLQALVGITIAYHSFVWWMTSAQSQEKHTTRGPPSSNIKNVLVVLGAPITAAGTPGPDLQQRLDRVLGPHNAKSLTPLHEHYSTIVVTGGNPQTYGSSGIRAEGVVMKEYLVSHGVAADKILVEDRALHSFHNALYTKQLLYDRHILQSETSAKARITILSHDWHNPRALLCFQIVWCDDDDLQNKLSAIGVPALHPRDPIVTHKYYKEQRLIEQFPYWCIEQEKDTPRMPPSHLARAKARNSIPDALQAWEALKHYQAGTTADTAAP